MRLVKKIRRLQIKLIWGTPRRLLLSVFRPGYVSKSLSRRRGSCRRCGACCRLVWRCRFFHHNHGLPACKLYGRFRFPNCIHFPIDHRDIADRDLLSPYTTCGFWWVREDNSGKPSKKPDHRTERHGLEQHRHGKDAP